MNGFQNTQFLLTRNDGRNHILQEPLEYQGRDGRLYRAPAGSRTDGLSTPPEAWFRIAPFGHLSADGTWRGWRSGILHDAAYRDTLEVCTTAGHWIPAHFDQVQADNLMNEMLDSEGLDEFDRVAVVKALRVFGDKAFAEDRATTSPP